jgi:hypothetical protein
LEANQEEIKSESEHQEVPKEEAVIETVGAQDDRSDNQRSAVVCRKPRKSRTRGNFAKGTPEEPMVEKRQGPRMHQ